MLKPLIHRLLRKFGYELTPRQGRSSLYGVLVNAKRNGFAPAGVIDVGAGRGDFTRLSHDLFSQARYLMIEPLDEFDSKLSDVSRAIPNALRVKAVAASASGSRMFNIHPDLFGSSLLFEDEATNVNGTPREVLAQRLEGLVGDAGLPAPFLLKIDVQGAEIEVLSGAEAILDQCSMIILETSLFKFFDGGPLLHEVIAWMEARDFLPYDIFGLAHRPLDGALAQADIVFVPLHSDLRRHHHYATASQRANLTERLRS
ncbi:MAG: FkbM family methyltransferase [Alphaproteobacteria bacterium]|nr:FkbM family methyltransferase [Alphaproteobacteria bacterium]